MSKTWLALSAGCIGAAVLASRPSRAAEPSAAGPPAADAAALPATRPVAAASLVGDEFRSTAHGIAFRPPIDCEKITTSLPDQIVEFDNEPRKWYFKAQRVSFSQPTPLTTYKDQYQQDHDGLMEATLKKLQQQPSAEVLMKEVAHVGPEGNIRVAMLAARYDEGLKRRLLQEAIIEANDQLYYVMDLNTPAVRGAAEPAGSVRGAGDGAADPEEKLASDTFNAVVDSVRLLDRAAIRQDQADRLIRTRGLFANWTPRYLQARLVPEQYFRLLRDGKDIGYTYEVQELDDKDGRIAGTNVIKVGVRSRTLPAAGTQVDAQSWLIVTIDRRHETWVNEAVMTAPVNGKAPLNGKTQESHISEIGASDSSVKAVASVAPARGLDAGAAGEGRIDESQAMGQPWVRMKETWALTVLRKNKQTVLPTFRQELPPFYLPQSLSHLLPRMLPFKEPKTYLFATYVADGNNGEPAVMLRYVDVLPPAEVTLDGKKLVAVPIKDHVGIEGPVTTHYVNPDDGSFLGSVSTGTDKDNTPSTLMILPADQAALEKLWGKPDLSRPNAAVGSPQDAVQGGAAAPIDQPSGQNP